MSAATADGGFFGRPIPRSSLRKVLASFRSIVSGLSRVVRDIPVRPFVTVATQRKGESRKQKRNTNRFGQYDQDCVLRYDEAFLL